MFQMEIFDAIYVFKFPSTALKYKLVLGTVTLYQENLGTTTPINEYFASFLISATFMFPLTHDTFSFSQIMKLHVCVF